uniref:Uncharacterized protein n=1 Tax=Oryzias melastigma TaxID=30732 RepID=A0A3B3BLV0_ORYME
MRHFSHNNIYLEWHWRGVTDTGALAWQLWGHSSEPSGQSMSPSQAHRRGTQMLLLHWKDVELQVMGGQEASSLPSSQSSSSSHTKEPEMHWPFLKCKKLSLLPVLVSVFPFYALFKQQSSQSEQFVYFHSWEYVRKRHAKSKRIFKKNV